MYANPKKKAAILKPGRKLSLETPHAGTQIVDFLSPELWEVSVV